MTSSKNSLMLNTQWESVANWDQSLDTYSPLDLDMDMAMFDTTLPSFGIESSLFDGETIGIIEQFNDWSNSFEPMEHSWEANVVDTGNQQALEQCWTALGVEIPCGK